MTKLVTSKKRPLTSTNSSQKSKTTMPGLNTSKAKLTLSAQHLPKSSTPLTNLTSTQETPSNATPISKIVEESKAHLQAQNPPKRGRGRPPKSSGAANHSAPGLGAGNNAGALPGGQAGATTAPPVAPPNPALVPVLQFPFKLAAIKTGYDGFKLDRSDAEGMVPLLDACLNQYMPTVGNSPHMALMAFGVTLAVTAGMKTMAYVEWKAEKQKRREPEPEPNETSQSAPAQVTPSLKFEAPEISAPSLPFNN